ncbi:MAG: TonB-dependent receptor [Ignavibacteriales bacterium]|nr:TonB-dependent receptor [Ignavibacteriales bacterium]
MKKIYVLPLILFSLNIISAQTSTGTVLGLIPGESSKLEDNIVIKLIEASSKTILQETTPRKDGSFIFRNIPFAAYDIYLLNSDELFATKRVIVNSTVPVKVFIDSIKTFQMESVVVSGKTEFDKSLASSKTILTQTSIEDFPALSSSKKIETIILSTPGVVPDEDGRMHVRGEDAQLQYVIDGIPVTGNMTRIYSSLFNAGIIKSVDLQTGNFNAEYGIANAAVLSVTTKSGFDKKLTANAYSSVGTFNSKDGGVELGGSLNENAAFFGAANFSSSDRYLDPISSSQPNHSFGKNLSYFGKADFILSSSIDLHFLGSINNTEFEIPNFAAFSNQDQRQKLEDYMLGSRLNITTDNKSVISALAYRRYAKMNFSSGGISRLNSPADYNKAINENEKMFIGGERINENNGIQLEYSSNQNWYSLHHVFKAGVSGELFPLKEFFTFAVTNPQLSDSTLPGGDIRYKPYDITQGGKPFLVDQSKNGYRFSAYAEDQFALNGKWTISAGIRFDQFNLFNSETGVSPRLSATYSANEKLILHASYNYIFMEAPVENILVSSSNEAKILTGSEQGQTSNVVKSERANVIEIGGAYRLNDNIDLELVGYSKFIDNFLVKVELGNSGIIFPVNLKNGIAAGGEFRTRLHNWNNFSGWLSFSTSVSLGLKPEDGSSPIEAGLILGEEGQNYSHPFAGEDVFPTEHNQLFTAVLNLTYKHPAGLFANLNTRFDSGLPFDLTDKNGVGLDEAASVAELKRRGYSDEVISLLSLTPEKPGSPDKSLKPRTIIDVAFGYNFKNISSIPLEISISILNLFDSTFLYKFESTFGGTHFGYPRMAAMKARLSF